MKYFIFKLSIFLIFSSPLICQEDIIGETSKEEIFNLFPFWKEISDIYVPKQEIINQLKDIKKEIFVEVIFGTWCPDSETHVSSFIKVISIVSKRNIKVKYFGISRGKKEPENLIKEKNILKVPTFIVYIGGKEKGRIIETPEKSIEEDLLNITIKEVSHPLRSDLLASKSMLVRSNNLLSLKVFLLLYDKFSLAPVRYIISLSLI